MARHLNLGHEYDFVIEQGGQATLNDTNGRFSLKGRVSTYADLPTTNNLEGDTYMVESLGAKYYWWNDSWNVFADTTAVISAIDSYMSTTSPNAVQNKVITNYVNNAETEAVNSAKVYTNNSIDAAKTTLRSETAASVANLQTQVTNLKNEVEGDPCFSDVSISGDSITLTKTDASTKTVTVTHPQAVKGIQLNTSTKQYEHTNTCLPITDTYKNLNVKLDAQGHVVDWVESGASITAAERGLQIVSAKIGHINSTTPLTSTKLLKIAVDDYGHITDYETATSVPTEVDRGLSVVDDKIGHAGTYSTVTNKLCKITTDAYGHITGTEEVSISGVEADRGLNVLDGKVGHDNLVASKADYKLVSVAYDEYGHITNSNQISNTDGSLYVNDSSHGINKINHKNSVTPNITPGLYNLTWDTQGHITGYSSVVANRGLNVEDSKIGHSNALSSTPSSKVAALVQFDTYGHIVDWSLMSTDTVIYTLSDGSTVTKIYYTT